MHDCRADLNRNGRQAGAALAVSLLILIVLTLLAIAAMRSSRVELRLSQNTESHVASLQTAQALADLLTQTDANLPIFAGPGYVGCFTGSGSSAPDTVPNTTQDQYPCADTTTAKTAISISSALSDHSYAQVVRETPEFLTTAAMRGSGNSSRSYDFAKFTVTGGYDNTTNGFGAAEVRQGSLKLHAKAQGVSYQ